jgi:hypothetical protein
LQLFRPDGTPVAYAKIGWDGVTNAQVGAESEALRAVCAAAPRTVHAPVLLHAGPWQQLELCVTAPLPPKSRRVPRRHLPPVHPLVEVAALDGEPERGPLGQSAWWRAIEQDAPALEAQAPGLGSAIASLAATEGDVELRYGRWHGDWVAWNMALGPEGMPEGLYVWDWEYSRPAVPFGFDLLHFFFQDAFVARRQPLLTAFSQAAEHAWAGLRELGIGPDEQLLLRRLHRIELRLRAERAVRAGAEADPGVREVPISTLLAQP